MKNYHDFLARKIKRGEQIALYCYGILASHMLCCLEKFYGVLPTVVIDNDVRKKGSAEFGVPVMPFTEARKQFEDLQYFICSDDFKYTIIADMLEAGVRPEAIINYVPVEKRKTCLYFYNRLLLMQGPGDETQFIRHCNNDSFKPQTTKTAVVSLDGSYAEADEIIDQAFADFENGKMAACRDCVMNKDQYIVAKDYPKHYKSVAFYQENCTDCLAHCVYCCVGGGTCKGAAPSQTGALGSYAQFVDSVLALDRVDDDFTCALDMSERDYDRKIGLAVECMAKAGLTPIVYKINSCLLVYSEQLAQLLRQGMAYVIWSLDAGTRETYRKVKQIDGFDHAVKNTRRYVSQDIFGGRFIVAKYLIVKGLNDNEEEFDAFLRIVAECGLQYVALSFDFYTDAEEQDLLFIQSCYQKITNAGLDLTYKNNSGPVTAALEMNSIMCQ